MQKMYFHNKKLIDQNTNKKRLFEEQYINKKHVVDINKLLNRVKTDQKKIIPSQYNGQKRIVDINILLNRVRVDKVNETKRKIIFYSSSILSLGFFSIFIMFIK